MLFNEGATPLKWCLVLGLLLLGAIVLSFLHLFGAPLLAIVLTVAGIVAYHQSTNTVVRATATAAIAVGTIIILISVLIAASQITPPILRY